MPEGADEEWSRSYVPRGESFKHFQMDFIPLVDLKSGIAEGDIIAVVAKGGLKRYTAEYSKQGF